MLVVRQSDDVVGGEVAFPQQLQHDVGDVDVELAGDLHHVPRRAAADDDVPHAGDRGESLSH